MPLLPFAALALPRLRKSPRPLRKSSSSSRAAAGVLLTATIALGSTSAGAQPQQQIHPACNVGALVAAIQSANASNTGGEIHLPANCVYSFSSPNAGGEELAALPTFTGEVIVRGNGSRWTRAAGASPFRILTVRAGAQVKLHDLGIDNGRTPDGAPGVNADLFDEAGPGLPGGDGGGILNRGNLTLSRVTLESNTAGNGGNGGACWADGLFAFDRHDGGDGGRGGRGGGIANEGFLVLDTGTIVRNNRAGDGGTGGSCPNDRHTARGGPGGAGGDGGGVANWGNGSNFVRDSTLFANRAGTGGNAGVGANSGNPPSALSYGHAGAAGDGGGLSAVAGVVVERSVIAENGTGGGGNSIPWEHTRNECIVCSGGRGGNGGRGGGLFAESGTVDISETTILRNFAVPAGDGYYPGEPGGGGGLFLDVVATIHNSTILQNRAGSSTTCAFANDGGGMRLGPATDLTIRNITLADNETGSTGCWAGGFGGIVLFGYTPIVRAANSLLAGGEVGLCNGNGIFIELVPNSNLKYRANHPQSGDCSAIFANTDPNLIPLSAEAYDAIFGPDPLGPDLVLIPGPGSLVVNAGSSCLAIDQRGVVRPQGAACDVGAVETRTSVLTHPAGLTTDEHTTVSFHASVFVDSQSLPTIQWQESADGTNWTDIAGGITESLDPGSRYSTRLDLVATRAHHQHRFRALFKNRVFPQGLPTQPAQLVVRFGPDLLRDLPALVTVNVGQVFFYDIQTIGYPDFRHWYERSTDGGATWTQLFTPGDSIGGRFRVELLASLAMYDATQAGLSHRYRLRYEKLPLGSSTPQSSTEMVVNVTNDPGAPSGQLIFENPDVREGQMQVRHYQILGNPTPQMKIQTSADGGLTWSDLTHGANGYSIQYSAVEGILAFHFTAWGYHDGLQYRLVLNDTLLGPARPQIVIPPTRTTLDCPDEVLIGEHYDCTVQVEMAPARGPMARKPVGQIRVQGAQRDPANAPDCGPQCTLCTLDSEGRCTVGFLSTPPENSLSELEAYFGLFANGPADMSVGYRTVTNRSCLRPVISSCASSLELFAGDSCTAEMPDLSGNVEYSVLGCSATVDQTVDIGTVLPIGFQQVDIEVTSGGGTATCYSDVQVRDTSTIEIEILGEAEEEVQCKSSWSDSGARARRVCGVISWPLYPQQYPDTSFVGDRIVTYTITAPPENQVAYATRTVRVIDSVPPSIALTGPAVLPVERGQFVDPGAVAIDGCVESFAATPVLSGDPNVPGTYTVTYEASDPSGNAAEPVVRTLHVADTRPPRVTTVEGAVATDLLPLPPGARTNLPLDALVVRFDEPLADLGAGLPILGGNVFLAFDASDSTTDPADCDAPPSTSGFLLALDPAGSDFTLTRTDALALAEGRYQILVCDGVEDPYANALDGDRDGIAGGDFRLEFRIDRTAPRVHSVMWGGTGAPLLDGQAVAIDNLASIAIRLDSDLASSAVPAEGPLDPGAYLLIRDGGDGQFSTSSCSFAISGDDVEVVALSRSYSPGPPLLFANFGTSALVRGSYRLLVCGTGPLADLAGNALDGDADGTAGGDFRLDFRLHAYPVAVLPTGMTGVEGTPIALDGSASSDADGPLAAYEWDFAFDGSFEATATGATTSVTYTDNGVRNFALRVRDADGATALTFGSVLVTNANPVVGALVAPSANEGSPASASASFSDAGSADTHGARFTWGDGAQTVIPSVQGSAASSHTYADDGVYTVSLSVTDDDGGAGQNSGSVTVQNVAPTVNTGSSITIEEGETATLTTATFSDPGTLDTHQSTIQWGDGSSASVASIPPGARSVTGNHLYDDEGTYTVVITVTDDDGGADSESTTVVVSDVTAPKVAAVTTENDPLIADETTRELFLQLRVAFDDTMAAASSAASSFLLVSDGQDGFQTSSCAPGPQGNDTPIAFVSTTHAGGSATTTLLLAAPLGDGRYRLFACAANVDTGGNALDGNADGTGGDDFRIDFRIDRTAPANPALASSSHVAGVWSAVALLEVGWPAASDGAGIGVAGYSFLFDTNATTEADLAFEASAGPGPFTASTSPGDGAAHWFHLRTCDALDNCSATAHLGPFRIDRTPPVNPTLSSSSHTVDVWTDDTELDLLWSGATDAGSGVGGFSVAMDQSATTTPSVTPNLPASATSRTETLADGDGRWFHLRTCDAVGQCAAAVHLGPFRIDATAPSAPGDLASPSHAVGQTSGDTTIDVTWSAASDATSGIAGYAWEFNAEADWTCPAGFDGDESTLSATSGALESGDWYAHLCALDAAANAGAVVRVGPFTLDATAPALTHLRSVAATPDGELESGETIFAAITQILFAFDEPLAPASVTPLAFALVEAGTDGAFDTAACGPVAGDDVALSPTAATLRAGDREVAVRLPAPVGLPSGRYRAFVCPAIEDRYTNAFDGAPIEFHVVATNRLPDPNFDDGSGTLSHWQAALPPGTTLSVSTADAGDEATSGSLRLAGPGTTGDEAWLVSRCFPLAGPVDRAGGRIRTLAGTSVAPRVRLGLLGYADPDCVGAADTVSLSAPISGITSGWTPVEFAASPSGATSARIALSVTPVAAVPLEILFDDLFARAAAMLFGDGFESGTTGSWSQTSPLDDVAAGEIGE